MGNLVDLRLEGRIKCDGRWVAAWRVLIGGVEGERLAWQRKGRWGKEIEAGRQQGKWQADAQLPEEAGALASARKGPPGITYCCF